MYRRWLAGEEWRPRRAGPRPRRGARATSGPEPQGSAPSAGAGAGQALAPVETSVRPLVDYPFPLRRGVRAHLHLPEDLSTDEARRLGAFVATLAVEDAGAADASVDE